MSETTRAPAPIKCVYPDCQHTQRTRGVCHGHYQLLRARVRDGKVEERDLERRGLLLPKGEGTSGVGDPLGAFLTGSDVRGEAPKSIDAYFARLKIRRTIGA